MQRRESERTKKIDSGEKLGSDMIHKIVLKVEWCTGFRERENMGEEIEVEG